MLDALWAEGGWEGGAKTNQDIKRRQRKANLIKDEGGKHFAVYLLNMIREYQ